MRIKNHKKLKAASLLSIMIYIIIAGIIVGLSVSPLQNMVTKAKQAEAKNELERIHTLQRMYHLEFSKYSTELKTIGYEQGGLVTEGGRARYKIEVIEAAGGTYTARATCVEDFDNDGVFNTWEINQDRDIKETQED
ncbi:MAG: general secretion pathway protein GspG [Flavobacteriales bacterium]|nr:general secretion pathway protein GspG [Flavobacteriales bacterium]